MLICQGQKGETALVAGNESDIEILRRENEQLKKEKLLIQNQVMKVEKIREILPANYQLNMQRLKQLEVRCHRLQKIVDFGNISGLQTLIEQFTTYSRAQLKKISTEMQFTEYGDIENKSVQDFIFYLDYIKEELCKLVPLQAPEKFLENQLLSECKKEMSHIVDKFHNTKKITNLKDEKIKELFYTLQSFNQILQQYFSDEAKKHE